VGVLRGRDLAQILIGKGLNSAERVREWLASAFPVTGGISALAGLLATIAGMALSPTVILLSQASL